MAKSVEIIFRPLDRWPREAMVRSLRKVSPFKTKFPETIRQLRYELRALDAPSAVIQAAFDERDLQVSTGMFRPDRTPSHPGVIVASDTRHGALKWVCDACVKWTDNVHAIMLTLERLRLADLYGVTSKGEQYAGWKMLPGPITLGSSAGPGMTIDEAARFVSGLTGIPAATILKSRGIWEAAYKDAAKKLHPDKGGDDSMWAKLQDAATLLNSMHNR